MEKQTGKKFSRKKFMGLGLAAASLFAGAKFFFFPKKTKKVKMLTQDGKLVEIDVANLPSKKIKIKDEEIHNWISPKSPL